jgi:drug/metabolite transporter (DMT)-like permease
VSILSVGVIALLVIDLVVNQATGVSSTPLGTLTFMSLWHMLVAIFIGILFTLAIYLLYTALQKGEASRVIPLIGGSMPVIIYLMTFFIDPLDQKKLTTFIFLVIGTVLISLMPKTKDAPKKRSGNLIAWGASFSFALFFVLTQYLFRTEGFINGIVWPRLGSLVALVFLFSYPEVRKLMRESLRHLSKRMKTLWVASQALGAIGFVGQQYVISIPKVSVALVSALQSVQYVFILVFATLVSFFKPKLLQEHISTAVIVQKVAALICIGIGLYFVAI